MKRFFLRTLRPEIFQGKSKKPPYFEGWYFKLVNGDCTYSWAIIPGVFFGQTEEQTHAFIQFLDGRHHEVTYHRFPIDQFQFSLDSFQVGDNTFSHDSLKVRTERIEANVSFQKRIGWPVTLRSPGIMGWYAWIPFMECYHGVVSLDHVISGSLSLGGERFQLDGGR